MLWKRLLTGWGRISTLFGTLAAIFSIAWLGRQLARKRTLGAREKTSQRRKEAEITMARTEGQVDAALRASATHAARAEAHEVRAAEYEDRIAAAKARAARLREGL